MSSARAPVRPRDFLAAWFAASNLTGKDAYNLCDRGDPMQTTIATVPQFTVGVLSDEPSPFPILLEHPAYTVRTRRRELSALPMFTSRERAGRYLREWSGRDWKVIYGDWRELYWMLSGVFPPGVVLIDPPTRHATSALGMMTRDVLQTVCGHGVNAVEITAPARRFRVV